MEGKSRRTEGYWGGRIWGDFLEGLPISVIPATYEEGGVLGSREFLFALWVAGESFPDGRLGMSDR